MGEVVCLRALLVPDPEVRANCQGGRNATKTTRAEDVGEAGTNVGEREGEEENSFRKRDLPSVSMPRLFRGRPRS